MRPVARRPAGGAAPAIPVIGIGAGPDVDGQVLVFHDLLGLYDGSAPRFVKRYAELGAQAMDAVGAYAGEVRAGAFPAAVHGYAIADEQLEAFETAVEERERERARH